MWLSDLHLDPYYGTKLAASHKNGSNCSLPNNATIREHPYGQVGCDAPPSLLELALQHASKARKSSANADGSSSSSIDFVLITGDFARHEMDELLSDPTQDLQVYDTVETILSTCIQTIQQNLPNVPIFPVLGNNDVVPDYYLEDADDSSDEPSDTDTNTKPPPFLDSHSGNSNLPDPHEMLQSIANGLAETFVDDDEFSAFVQGGYFSRLVPLSSSSILVLSLNTILYSTRHEPYSKDDPDPYGQFEWMKSQLRRVAASPSNIVGIYLAGHIPPSIGSYRHSQLWHGEYLQEFSTILQDYAQGKYNPQGDTTARPPPILGNFYGHVHTEEFRLLQYGLEGEKNSKSENPLESGGSTTNASNTTSSIATSKSEPLVVPVLVTSSITPIYGSNPSYRLVEYSDETGALLDYKTHYLDLDKTVVTDNTDSNGQQDDPWIALPSFAQDYGVPDLSLNSFQKVLQTLEQELAYTTEEAFCGNIPQNNTSITSNRLWETFRKRQNLYSSAQDDGDDNGNDKSQTAIMIDWLCTFGATTTQEYQGCLGAKQANLSERAKQCGYKGGFGFGGGPTASKFSFSWDTKSLVFLVGTSVAASIGLVLLFLGLRRCYRRRSKRKLYAIPQENDHDHHHHHDDGEEPHQADGVFMETNGEAILNDDGELI